MNNDDQVTKIKYILHIKNSNDRYYIGFQLISSMQIFEI